MPAQEARCAAVGNTVMSAPVSAMTISATVVEKPGMLVSSSRAARKGSISSAIRASSSPIVWSYWSINVRCMRIKKPWCAVNRPVSVSVRMGIFDRIRRRASSASAVGSSCPSIRACSIARPETLMMSVATEDWG